MKITGLECWQEKMKLAEPYTIAYETIDTTTNVFMRIDTDRSPSGFGCAAPDLEVTGETGETVMTAFRDIIEPYLLGKAPFTYALILDELKTLLHGQPAALTMVDMALFDLIGKKTQEPVYRLLGGYRDAIPTSVTVGILPVQETLERAKAFMQQGFFILKVKGGTDVDEDVERIMKLREMVGPDMEIRFDANQGYSVKEAVCFMHQIRSAKIELLEQPTKREEDHLLKQVSRQVSVPVMADESLMGLADVFHLTANNSTDMINIKLMKAGGIMEGIRINAVAIAANVETMVGCMDESAMGISAGLHFALARPNILYADLDGHFDLIDDPFAAMVRCEKGVLYPSDRPGFGWEGK
ncbi:mandelate racemase/muconate lactonizing enzyme family protein [Reichenbachiella sp. MSK19-1]|uniref:mandelate racemase/muconate lactonizing enzyme family protein n=1 Tax=Reichenbachiella sp. MSK19-1 TaxID=1897631 RepID=UPI000EEECB19|nr:dipeptide epimerase [Reichenbachiella sp. MSK19-1]RJE72575.1 dipeptide epimerase [Reichenbachiella sp. MSK19-1]